MMNEAETRAEHIDPALKAAGWGVLLRAYREFEERVDMVREGRGA